MENLENRVIGRRSFWQEQERKDSRMYSLELSKVPNNSKVLNLTTEEGKKKNKENTLAFEKLILSIDTSMDKRR